jgi:hypothetical protein
MRNGECGMKKTGGEGREARGGRLGGEGPGSLSGLLPPTAYLLPPDANIRRLPFQAILNSDF